MVIKKYLIRTLADRDDFYCWNFDDFGEALSHFLSLRNLYPYSIHELHIYIDDSLLGTLIYTNGDLHFLDNPYFV